MNGVEHATGVLLKMGLTPSQVAYVFRGVMDGIMKGVSVPSVKQVDEAFAGKVDAVSNGFSMADDDGYCYLRGIKAVKRVDVALDLGSQPSVKRFMSLNSEEYDIHALKKLAFCEPESGKLHLRAIATGEVSAYDSLAATLHNKITGISPSYRAFSRGGKYVTPLSLTATIGVRPKSGAVDCGLAECMVKAAEKHDKVVVVVNPGGVAALSETVLSVTVVTSESSSDYVNALFPRANVITPRELSTREHHDVVIVTSDSVVDFEGMKTRIGKSALFAQYCVGFCALDVSDVTLQVSAYLKTFPIVDNPTDCYCGLLMRVPLAAGSSETGVTHVGEFPDARKDNSWFWVHMAGVTVTYKTPADALMACSDLSLYDGEVYTINAVGRSVNVMSDNDFEEALRDRKFPFVCVHKSEIASIEKMYGQDVGVMSVESLQETTFDTVCLIDLGKEDNCVADVRQKVGVALTRHTRSLNYYCPRWGAKSMISRAIDDMLEYHDDIIETVMLPPPLWVKTDMNLMGKCSRVLSV